MSDVVSLTDFKNKKGSDGVSEAFYKMRDDEEFQASMEYVVSVMSDIIESNFDFTDKDGNLVLPEPNDIILICEAICSMIMRRKGVDHPYQQAAEMFAKPFEDVYDFT